MTTLKGHDLLSKTQCNALRGVAILSIVIHNFCHWLNPKVIILENEFNYNHPFSQRMWHYLTGGNIDMYLPIQFFSFFGHYGVAIFLFLSGFGLVRKYEGKRSEKSTAEQFIIYHWKKLFRLMLLGLLVGLFVHAVYDFFYPKDWIKYFIAQLLLIINVLKEPELNIMPGPFWFFGLMLEVYVIYRIFIYPTHNIKNQEWKWLRWFIPLALVIAAWLIQEPLMKRHLFIRYLRYNAVVAMLPFATGVLVARYGFPHLPKLALATVSTTAIVALMLVNLNFHTWLWGHLVVIAGSVSFVKLFEAKNATIQHRLNVAIKPLTWTGALSAYIFVVHPIVRLPLYFEVMWGGPKVGLSLQFYLWILIYLAITMLLACGYQYYLELYPAPKLKTINNE
ncbi:MAG: acyltransferase family protein [Muribaculaceae bacterium]|nr:acyltransferase family protein [Muribaculaceae bacterium]